MQQDIFVDTNVFMRYLLWDLPKEAQEAEDLFRGAIAPGQRLVTTELVMAELVWTLESYYRKPRQTIAELVLAILSTPGLTVTHADLIRDAIELYVNHNVDFIDGFSAAYMKMNRITRVKSFDKHFSRFQDIQLV